MYCQSSPTCDKRLSKAQQKIALYKYNIVLRNCRHRDFLRTESDTSIGGGKEEEKRRREGGGGGKEEGEEEEAAAEKAVIVMRA